MNRLFGYLCLVGTVFAGPAPAKTRREAGEAEKPRETSFVTKDADDTLEAEFVTACKATAVGYGLNENSSAVSMNFLPEACDGSITAEKLNVLSKTFPSPYVNGSFSWLETTNEMSTCKNTYPSSAECITAYTTKILANFIALPIIEVQLGTCLNRALIRNITCAKKNVLLRTAIRRSGEAIRNLARIWEFENSTSNEIIALPESRKQYLVKESANALLDDNATLKADCKGPAQRRTCEKMIKDKLVESGKYNAFTPEEQITILGKIARDAADGVLVDEFRNCTVNKLANLTGNTTCADYATQAKACGERSWATQQKKCLRQSVSNSLKCVLGFITPNATSDEFTDEDGSCLAQTLVDFEACGVCAGDQRKGFGHVHVVVANWNKACEDDSTFSAFKFRSCGSASLFLKDYIQGQTPVALSAAKEEREEAKIKRKGREIKAVEDVFSKLNAEQANGATQKKKKSILLDAVKERQDDEKTLKANGTKYTLKPAAIRLSIIVGVTKKYIDEIKLTKTTGKSYDLQSNREKVVALKKESGFSTPLCRALRQTIEAKEASAEIRDKTQDVIDKGASRTEALLKDEFKASFDDDDAEVIAGETTLQTNKRKFKRRIVKVREAIKLVIESLETGEVNKTVADKIKRALYKAKEGTMSLRDVEKQIGQRRAKLGLVAALDSASNETDKNYTKDEKKSRFVAAIEETADDFSEETVNKVHGIKAVKATKDVRDSFAQDIADCVTDEDPKGCQTDVLEDVKDVLGFSTRILNSVWGKVPKIKEELKGEVGYVAGEDEEVPEMLRNRDKKDNKVKNMINGEYVEKNEDVPSDIRPNATESETISTNKIMKFVAGISQTNRKFTGSLGKDVNETETKKSNMAILGIILKAFNKTLPAGDYEKKQFQLKGDIQNAKEQVVSVRVRQSMTNESRKEMRTIARDLRTEAKEDGEINTRAKKRAAVVSILCEELLETERFKFKAAIDGVNKTSGVEDAKQRKDRTREVFRSVIAVLAPAKLEQIKTAFGLDDDEKVNATRVKLARCIKAKIEDKPLKVFNPKERTSVYVKIDRPLNYDDKTEEEKKVDNAIFGKLEVDAVNKTLREDDNIKKIIEYGRDAVTFVSTVLDEGEDGKLTVRLDIQIKPETFETVRKTVDDVAKAQGMAEIIGNKTLSDLVTMVKDQFQVQRNLTKAGLVFGRRLTGDDDEVEVEEVIIEDDADNDEIVDMYAAADGESTPSDTGSTDSTGGTGSTDGTGSTGGTGGTDGTDGTGSTGGTDDKAPTPTTKAPGGGGDTIHDASATKMSLGFLVVAFTML